MEIDVYLNGIRQLLADNNLEVAFQKLLLSLNSRHFRDEVLLISSKFKELQRKARMGIIDKVDSSVSRNKIVFEILELLNEIEPKDIRLNQNKNEHGEELNNLTHKDEYIEGSNNLIPGSTAQIIDNNNANIENQVNIQEFKDGNIIFERHSKKRK